MRGIACLAGQATRIHATPDENRRQYCVDARIWLYSIMDVRSANDISCIFVDDPRY